MKKYQVGGELVHFCPKCQLELGHTVLAMVSGQPARVRCNTCKSERNFRARKLFESSSKASTIPRSRQVNDVSQLYQNKIKESLMKSPKTYSIHLEVSVGDLIQHPKFGRGVVLKTIPPDRMEIVFSEGIKVLAGKC